MASGAGRRLDDHGVDEERRLLRDRGELRRELAEDEVLAALLDEAERGGVPERGAPAVAEQHLVPVGEGVEVRGALTDAADDGAHALAAVTRAEKVGAGGGEAGQRVGADLRRARAESTVGRTQLRRQLDGHPARLPTAAHAIGVEFRPRSGLRIGCRPQHEFPFHCPAHRGYADDTTR